MTEGYVVTVACGPLVETEHTPLLVRWNMAFAHARTGWRRPVRQAAKMAFRLVHQRLGIPATAHLRLGGPDGARVFQADMANTTYSTVVLAERSGGFEPDLAALLRQLASRLDTVFDVGANCGFFSARLLTTPGFSGHVHAFELVPATYEALTRMRRDCGFDASMTCHPFGLSSEAAKVCVDMGVHSSLARVAERGSIHADVKTLDSLDLPAPDLVKIDVEGHETEVLDGARRTLETALPFVVFESWYRPDDPAAMRAPFERLAALGYRFFGLNGSRSPGGGIRLRLEPVTPGTRSNIRAQLNVLAIPETRVATLNETFLPLND